ncbi:ferredoxin--NADP reductase [bacterium]|nr:ferredoxin--NADP reductase [bacterium]
MGNMELNAVVTQRHTLAPGLMIMRVAPDGWELPEFQPGQFAVLGLPPTAPKCEESDTADPDLKPDRLIRRAYSIASSSKSRQYVEFFVVLVKSGALTPRLFALEPGDKVFLAPKITGMFTLQDLPDGKNVILVSTGTGLAPYMSMLRTYLAQHHWERVATLHGARHSWDLAYTAELDTMAALAPNFTYIPIISRPRDEAIPWEGWSGYVQDLWTNGVIEKQWGFKPEPENTHVFLCGNPAMIDTMVKVLEGEGFNEHTRKGPGNIHLERYW